MSKDDTGPKRLPREEDPSYVTMPPELRAFAKPMVEGVMKPGDDPILDAALRVVADVKAGPAEFRGQVLAALGPLDSPRLAALVLDRYPDLDARLR